MSTKQEVISRDQILRALNQSRMYVSEIMAHAPSGDLHKRSLASIDAAIDTVVALPEFFVAVDSAVQ